MSIDTVVRKESIPAREHTITHKKAAAYGIATQDFNKIHELVAYGYNTSGLLQKYADSIMANTAPQMQCTHHRVDFERFIPFDSTVQCYAQTDVTRDGNTYYVKVAMRMKGQKEPVAISTMTYGMRATSSPNLVLPVSLKPIKEDEVSTMPYSLTDGDVTVVAQALATKEEEEASAPFTTGQRKKALEHLAIALTSNAIWNYDRENKDKKDEDKLAVKLDAAKLVPVYTYHDVKLYLPLGELNVEDKILIATDAKRIAKKIERRLARGVQEVEGLPFTLQAEVMTNSGSLIATEELKLTFGDKKSIDVLIAQQRALIEQPHN